MPRSAVIVFLHFFKTVQGRTDFSSNLYLEDDCCGACAWRGGRWAEKVGDTAFFLELTHKFVQVFFCFEFFIFLFHPLLSESLARWFRPNAVSNDVEEEGLWFELDWTKIMEYTSKIMWRLKSKKNGENIDWQIYIIVFFRKRRWWFKMEQSVKIIDSKLFQIEMSHFWMNISKSVWCNLF